MERDWVNKGWGPEDCYPDGAYEAEERRNKINWWKRFTSKAGFPNTGVYIVMRDTDSDAGKDDLILKHETGVQLPFRIDAGETITSILEFFSDVFPCATLKSEIAKQMATNNK